MKTVDENASACTASSESDTLSLLQRASAIGRFGAWAYDVAEQRLIWSNEVAAIHDLPPGYAPTVEEGINFYHIDDRPRIASLFAACLSHGVPFDVQLTLISAKGRELQVRSMAQAVRDAQGNIVRLEGACQDVSEQHARNQRLAESETLLNAVFNQSYIYQGLLDHHGVLIRANTIAFSACGYKPTVEIGRPFWECSWWRQDAEIVTRMHAFVRRAIAGETVDDEIDYFVASGERRQTQFSAVPIYGAAGELMRVLVSGLDITERKRDETFHTGMRKLFENVAMHRPLPEILLGIVELMESRIRTKRCSVNLLDAEGLRLTQGYGPSLPASYMQLLKGLAIGPNVGSCGTAAFERQVVAVEDIETDPRWANFRDIVRPFGLRSCWSVPIFNASGRVLGTFAVYDTVPSLPMREELALVSDCAHVAGVAIERECDEATLRDQASLLDKAHDAIIVRDLEHQVVFWNQGAEKLYGWTSAEAQGKNVSDLLYLDPLIFTEATRKVLGEGEWQGEVNQHDRNGRPLWVDAHWSLVRDENGVPKSILAINTDVTQRKASEHEIYNLAFHDSLTGLPNRQLLHNRLAQALAACARNQETGGILFLDLDNFKSLNDTQGHDVGDKLLVQVAARLSSSVRECDTVARIGGDEFVIMLDGLVSLRAEAAAQAQAVAEKILSAFAQPFDLDGDECVSTPSIGVALFSDNQLTVDEILKRADLAMYQAKAAGRNTVRFYDPEMQAAVSLRVQMEKDLRHGLINHEFVLYYQAQVNAAGCLTGAEVLLRWQHPQHGMMPPLSFIPVAEDSGLILPIGRWILETACRQLARWASLPAKAGLTIAVNVSARQFRHPGFVAEVREILAQTGARPELLKLELTESQLVDNVEETIDKMQALRNLGVSFSLDDFGTGYSSMSYLKRLPLAQLKIDPSFVRDILNNQSDAAIARTVIALGQSLGLSVIAEGVEASTQRDLLHSLGCYHYQGYLFSKPLPIEQFDQLALPSLNTATR